jgi:hypothetical protein
MKLEHCDTRVVSWLNDHDMHSLSDVTLDPGHFVKLSWSERAAHPLVAAH